MKVDDAFVDAMTGGCIPTSPAFVCPICCGPARASASPRGDVLSVSIRCPCSAMELDDRLKTIWRPAQVRPIPVERSAIWNFSPSPMLVAKP